MNYIQNLIQERIRGVLRGLGFYLAILIPLLYIPLLAYGFKSGWMFIVLLGMVAINVVAAYVGHAYNPRV